MSLQCRQLSIEISGKLVCNKLDLTITPGQIWGILGRNGIGKTTLLHTLAGLRVAAGGDIFINDQNIQQLKRKQIAQKLGVLLQHHEDSFPGTVLETVLTGRHPHINTWQWENETDFAIARQALQQVDMHAMENKSVQHLSGGERQRVAIATLFAQDPTYYLLDEPNSHLDLHYQINILDSLCQFARSNRRALIMTLHDINLASRFCDYVLLLNGDGKILQGTANELLTPQHLAQTFKHEIIAIRGDHGSYFQPK
jgi:iron complex transport system ATP-binding protein